MRRSKDNVTQALRARLRGTPRRAFSESLKVVTDVASHYPDVVVTCTPVQPTDDAKWVGYQDIPSLQHYVLIAQDRRRVELFTRAGDGWHLAIIRPPVRKVQLSALRVELSLDEIYEDSGA